MSGLCPSGELTTKISSPMISGLRKSRASEICTTNSHATCSKRLISSGVNDTVIKA
jgi:hypothetical protein